MYPNLRAEIARKGLDNMHLSEMTGIKYQRLCSKMNGKGKFTMDEGVSIKKALDVDMPLEELLKKEE